MIWMAWRQFRAQAIVAVAALAVVAIALAVTGPHLAGLFNSSGLAVCQAHGDCGSLVTSFMAQVKATTPDGLIFAGCIGLLLAAPGLIGVFWGAPLVTREIEAGTFRLAWNQSVTRTHWLAVKLGLIGLASMAATGLLTLMVTWWARPLDRVTGLPAGLNGTPTLDRFAPLLFATRGITPIGYAAFAFALGVTTGVLLRRTVPAMAVTLAVFAAVQIVMPLWIRPHFLPPSHVATALNPATIDGLNTSGDGRFMSVQAAFDLPGAWVLADQAVTPAGRVFSGPAPAACVSNSASFSECEAGIARLHLRQRLTYQPPGRYWAFQADETAIFVVLAAGLGACCAWIVRRRAW